MQIDMPFSAPDDTGAMDFFLRGDSRLRFFGFSALYQKLL